MKLITFLTALATGLGIVATVAHYGSLWQAHLDHEDRVHDAVCQRIDALVAITYAEHSSSYYMPNFKECP